MTTATPDTTIEAGAHCGSAADEAKPAPAETVPPSGGADPIATRMFDRAQTIMGLADEILGIGKESLLDPDEEVFVEACLTAAVTLTDAQTVRALLDGLFSVRESRRDPSVMGYARPYFGATPAKDAEPAWENATPTAIRSAGIAALADALPLTAGGRAKLAADVAAAEALMAECAREGSFGQDRVEPKGVDRVIGLCAHLSNEGWPPHFAAACALAETDLELTTVFSLLGAPSRALMPRRNPPAVTPATEPSRIVRVVTRGEVLIQGRRYRAEELAGLEGERLVLEVPSDPLPEVLHATCESLHLVLREHETTR